MARVVVGLDAVWDDAVAERAHRRVCPRRGRPRRALGVRARPVRGRARGVGARPSSRRTPWCTGRSPRTSSAGPTAVSPDDLRVRRDPTAPADLDGLVADVFGGYVNHYTANPLLEPDLALAGYVDWVRRTALDDPGSLAVLMHGDESVGVATWFVDPAGGFVEILLAGLVPGGARPRLVRRPPRRGRPRRSGSRCAARGDLHAGGQRRRAARLGHGGVPALRRGDDGARRTPWPAGGVARTPGLTCLA